MEAITNYPKPLGGGKSLERKPKVQQPSVTTLESGQPWTYKVRLASLIAPQAVPRRGPIIGKAGVQPALGYADNVDTLETSQAAAQAMCVQHAGVAHHCRRFGACLAALKGGLLSTLVRPQHVRASRAQ